MFNPKQSSNSGFKAKAKGAQTHERSLIDSSNPKKNPQETETWTPFTAMRRKIYPLRSASWASACLALSLLIVTAIYASRSELIAGYRVIGRSSSNVLLMLRVLSELAGLMLAATIADAFKKVQWMLIGRDGNKPGVAFADYLGLQPGTGILGLLQMAFGWRGSKLSSRIWSSIRLIAIVIVPLLNVLIMSKVGTTIAFDKLDKTAPTYGYGIGSFNASLASLWLPMTDLLFSTNFVAFLSDGTRVVDITSPTARAICDTSALDKQECKLRYYVAGGVENFAPWLLAAGRLEADAFLAENQQGYLFEFEDGSDKWQYQEEKECSIYGAQIAAWALCLKNGGSNEIQARVVVCPIDVAEKSLCQNDTTWPSKPGFSTSLRTWHRRATVAYSRVNGSILTHEFHDNAPAIEAPINASELLTSFNIVLKSRNSASPFASALGAIGIGNNTASMPLYAWWFFHGISELASKDNAARRRGIAGLQSLLGLPIYHCQMKDFAELRSLGYDNETMVGQAIVASLPTAEQDLLTPIFPAVLRYDISVGRASLIAYIVLGGVTLLLCFIAIAIGTLTEPAQVVKGATEFPILDFMTRCEVVRDSTAEVVPNRELIQLGGKEKSTRIDETARMRVRIASRAISDQLAMDAGGASDGDQKEGAWRGASRHADQHE